MVALHNRRLGPRDIWPDNLWTDDDALRVKDRIAQEVAAEGLTGLRARLTEAERFSGYIREKSPGLAEQQRIMLQIYPPRVAPACVPFSEEELRAILDRFAMANCETGQAIAQKVAAALG